MVVFGGGVSQQVYNDVWVFDTETSTWSSPVITELPPAPRAGHTVCVVGDDSGNDIANQAVNIGCNQMLVFGGGSMQRVYGDLIVLDLSM